MYKKEKVKYTEKTVSGQAVSSECININHLKVAYEKKEIIRDLTLSIPKGKITIIIGANGCGKSTLLKTIARIIKPKAGSVELYGKDIQKQNTREVAKSMAVLPQSPATPSGLMVRELVGYGRFPHQGTMKGLSEYDNQIIDWAIKAVGLQEYKDRPVEKLSGGQRQRAWIAMSLAQETEILLLDEPTTYLDMAHQLEVLLLLKKMNREQNRTIIMVLHELNLAARFADHIIGITNGELVCEGNPNDVINEANLYKLYGIQANILHNDQKNYPVCVGYELTKTAGTALS